MEILPQTGTSPAPATAQAGTTKALSSGSDFETFLKLLTTQMRNQDPLNPVDSTEFVSQLASFSAVEQQVRTNEQLESIFAVLSGNDTSSLSTWLGTEILAASPARFDGAPVSITKSAIPDADRAFLIVRNDFGAIISQNEVAPAGRNAVWDGRTPDGNIAATGRYSFEFAYYADDTLVATEVGQVFSRVTEARLSGSEIILVVDGGAEVNARDVTTVRSSD